ncbi:MAG: hypothetical protein L3K16_07765, partial [Thermoplasmata archaeon]|nr:hypothetical protein [Thermoplasmata archaeon]
ALNGHVQVVGETAVKPFREGLQRGAHWLMDNDPEDPLVLVPFLRLSVQIIRSRSPIENLDDVIQVLIEQTLPPACSERLIAEGAEPCGVSSV